MTQYAHAGSSGYVCIRSEISKVIRIPVQSNPYKSSQFFKTHWAFIPAFQLKSMPGVKRKSTSIPLDYKGSTNHISLHDTIINMVVFSVGTYQRSSDMPVEAYHYRPSALMYSNRPCSDVTNKLTTFGLKFFALGAKLLSDATSYDDWECSRNKGDMAYVSLR